MYKNLCKNEGPFCSSIVINRICLVSREHCLGRLLLVGALWRLGFAAIALRSSFLFRNIFADL